MSNTGVITAFNQCRGALFYRLRGQHRHPRTAKMLRYYLCAQDMHERISSAHVDYSEMAEQLKNTDLIFRIRRLLEMQGQACRNVAAALRNGKDYTYSKRLGRAMEGCRQSLAHYTDDHPESRNIHHIRRLLDNLSSVDYQLRQLQNDASLAENDNTDTRIAALENTKFRNIGETVLSQLNFESGVFRHATRLSIVVAAACIIVEILHLNLGYWILLTALFVCQPNYTATKSRVYQRIAGTILGVIVGSLVPYFTPSVETKLWIVIASTTLFFITRSYKYSFSTFFITIQALTSLSLAGLDVYHAMPIRIIDTIVGSVIAWAAATYLWPDWRYLTLSHTAAQTITANGRYLDAILDQLQNGSRDDVDYRLTRRQAHESTAALSSTLSDMSSNPKKYQDRLQDGFTLLKTSYALTGHISALGAYRDQVHHDGSDTFAPYARLTHHSAELLKQMPQTEPATFDASIEAIRQEFADLEQTDKEQSQQNQILKHQLDLIIRQLAPCYQALHRQSDTQTS